VTRPDEPTPDPRWSVTPPAYGAPPDPHATYGAPQYGSWDADGRWAVPQQDGAGAPSGRTNPMAIWGLVCAFLFAPLGLIFSVIGLNQISRRRERGRGLAVAGLVVSLVVLGVGAVVGAALVDQAADQLATDATSSDPAAPSAADPAPDAGPEGTPPAAPAPATVLEACNTMMPVLISAQDQLAAADTEADAMQVVADMRAAVVWAQAAPDPTFQQHLQALADDLQVVIDAVAARQTPANDATLEDHSFVVGKDCGVAGWTE
jgi:hypothetical protein